MKKLTWFVGALAAALLACAPAMAQDNGEAKAKPEKVEKGEKPDKAKTSALKGEYGIMASVLGMDDAQKAKLAEALEANKADQQQWTEGESGKKMEELSRAAAEAKKADDKEKTKKISEELKAVKESRAKLEEAGKQRIQAVLTDEQKTRYAGFNLERQVLRRLSAKKIELTEDQKKQMKDLCAEAAKAKKAETDSKALAAADKKLMGDIEQKVLTDAQREALKKPAEKADKGEKGKDGEKPAKQSKETKAKDDKPENSGV
jgi:Spy/CpxP family protein refolding chaperone